MGERVGDDARGARIAQEARAAAAVENPFGFDELAATVGVLRTRSFVGDAAAATSRGMASANENVTNCRVPGTASCGR